MGDLIALLDNGGSLLSQTIVSWGIYLDAEMGEHQIQQPN